MNLAEAKQVLLEHGQQQLLKYYDELDEGAKKALLDQISKINFSVFTKVGSRKAEL